MGQVIPFKREQQAVSPLEMLVQHWGEHDPELEDAIRIDCGKLLEQYSSLPQLSLELPVVDDLEPQEQAALGDALQAQINRWALDWHSKLLFELLGSELLRLREMHGYGPVPGEPV